MSTATWVAFLCAAGLGAAARYAVDRVVQEHSNRVLPMGTLVVNVSGCLVLGIVSGLVIYHGTATSVRTVVGTGCMGAYTTFSTFTFETVRLAEERLTAEAVRNVVANLVLGLLAAAAGLAVTVAF